jgi:hypothetical protein
MRIITLCLTVGNIGIKEVEHTGESFTGSFFTQTEVGTKQEEQITNDFDYLFLPHLKEKQQPTRSNLAISIVRTHFNEKFIDDLIWLSENHAENTHDSFPYLSSFLNNVKDYVSEYKDDIYCSFLLALYDSLINDDSYLSVSSKVYSQILKMIKFLNNKTLDYNLIDKYIFKLDEIGLNITPY